MKEQPVHPTNDDPRNESGRISRSGTEAGISVGNESTSGGEGPIEPGGKPNSDKQDPAQKR